MDNKSKKPLSDASVFKDARTPPPIEAPRDRATFTGNGSGISKPIGLKEVADLYSVSPAMRNLRGKGPGPLSGPFGLSIFEGEGGAVRIVGKTYFDRWQSSTDGMNQRPDYSWDGNDNTHIGSNTKFKDCTVDWYWLSSRLAGDTSKVLEIRTLKFNDRVSHITKDHYATGKKTTEFHWQLLEGTAQPVYSKGSSTTYSRHIVGKGSQMTFISDGVLAGAGPFLHTGMSGLKTYTANGFQMRGYCTKDAYGEWPWANYAEMEIDITVKV